MAAVVMEKSFQHESEHSAQNPSCKFINLYFALIVFCDFQSHCSIGFYLKGKALAE
jgi:hypothetical protein